MSDVVVELPASPWTGRVSAAAGTAALVSLAVVGLGWEGVSKQATIDDAQPWFIVGVIGLVIGFGTAVLWLSSAARRLRGVRSECHALLAGRLAERATTATATERVRRTGRYVRVTGMTKIHLATCELVAGKSQDELSEIPADADRCGMCRP
jgi:hypothetical protein